MKKLVSVFLALALLVCLAPGALAAASVGYDGSLSEFTFSPGSSQSPTDLFPNFKDVMPGDELTQQIVIEHGYSKNVKIRVYLRSLGAAEGSEDFLSQMNLSVEHTGEGVLFDAPAHEKAQLSDWVSLGTLYPGGKATLKVTLEVPANMDSSYADSLGSIDWQFKVEELPLAPGDPTPPQTGDSGELWLYIGVFALALPALLLLLLPRKRRE